MLYFLGLGFLIILGIYCWHKTKKSFTNNKALPMHTVFSIWTLDLSHFFIVVAASVNHMWELSLNSKAMFASGVILSICGVTIMTVGMVQFCSFRKISGMQISKLITNGIYAWNRNPQYVGWFFLLIGISIAGRSGFACFITTVFMTGIHFYTVILEEPFLKRIYGEEYQLYKEKVPRYFGIKLKH